jgi:hypothetical protein
MLKRSVQRDIAVLVTFFVSGMMHEYVASLALKVVSITAFMGIMLQAPIIAV